MADGNEIKRNIKDSVFSALFKEPKYLREFLTEVEKSGGDRYHGYIV